MKIAISDRENFHIFCTTWGISMKFSAKMWWWYLLAVLIDSIEQQRFNKWKEKIKYKNRIERYKND